MTDANGRYSLNTGILALPAQCICGALPGDRGLLDTGFDAEFYGVVYICHDCFRNMADVMGYLGPEERQTLVNEVGQTALENAQLQSTIVNLEKILDGYRGLSSIASGSNVSLNVESSASDTVPINSESVDEISDGSGAPEDSSSGEGYGDSEVDESVNLEESGGIPSITESYSEPDSPGAINDPDGISERIGLSL